MPSSGSLQNPAARTLALFLAAGACGAAVVACATTAGREAETTLAKGLVPTEQENQIGLQVKQELETKEHIRYMDDPAIVDYVRAVAANVIKFGQKDRSDVQWQVNVIDDPKTVNAFATPGGYLYVYSGLIATAENEAELAGVMAHETGHVVARHSARAMVAAYGLEAVASLATGQNPGLATQIGESIALNGVMLKHSRGAETEADEYGAKYASQAGYDPHALITFFQKLQAQEGHTPKILSYLSDHPATQDRIDHLNEYIAKNNLTGHELNAAPYAAIKQRVLSRPPPPAGGAAPAPGGAAPPPPGAAPPAPGAAPPP